jgi:CheY-like chemotaxis protein
VLLVEDNPITQQALVDSVEMLGYRALQASSGREALTIFEQHRNEIGLVLSDLVMPEMGGMALLKALKVQHPSIKMVIVSGYPLRGEIQELQAQGVVDWLQKPVDLGRLAQAMAQALREDKS